MRMMIDRRIIDDRDGWREIFDLIFLFYIWLMMDLKKQTKKTNNTSLQLKYIILLHQLYIY